LSITHGRVKHSDRIMGPVPFEYQETRARTQQTLVDFLNAEIALGITFTRSAVNSFAAGHMGHFYEAKDRATKAAEAVRKFMVRVVDGKIREDIEERLITLEKQIAAL
jgi:hypothetical protein